MDRPIDQLVASARTPAARARRAAKFVVRSASGAFFRAVGSDGTDEFADRSCVVLAPHPDDETFGCGATIARKRAAGTQVSVVIVADGSRAFHSESISGGELAAIRRQEALTAVSRLGVAEDDVVFLEFEDGALPERLPEIARALGPVIRSRSPQQVFVTSVMDRHPDHAALGRAARQLLESGDITGELHEYAIWQRVPPVSMTVGAVRSVAGGGERPARSSLCARAAQLRPRLVRTDGHLATKRHAISAYVSQMPVLPLGFVEDFLQSREVFVRVPG